MRMVVKRDICLAEQHIVTHMHVTYGCAVCGELGAFLALMLESGE